MWCRMQKMAKLATLTPHIRRVWNRGLANVCDGNIYDVIVIGGGHAGTEASYSAARMGAKTLLITHKKNTIGEMSCNPSFGGVGKGHLMREVDALGGICCRICDLSGIHYKVINESKGPAVWGVRAQIDRKLYKKNLQEEMFRMPNLEIIEAAVEDLVISEGTTITTLTNNKPKHNCEGVILSNGQVISGNSVIITTGTFLRGSINIGTSVRPAGRMGDAPAIGLALTLEKLQFRLGRLKTGTPPRINKNTIDFSLAKIQVADNPPVPFSFMNDKVWIDPADQIPCHIITTVPEVEQVIRDTLHCNRHISEEVRGPRYCPSLESKVLKFPGRIHQVFLEPEGLDSDLIYPMGLTCTMPMEDQQRLLRLIPSLRHCQIVTPGYGVEYDYVDPRELTHHLETCKVDGLFLAGQINGTTGYEEAGAQGLIAGVNAAAKAQGRDRLTVDRTEGYIGVLIDDLTTHGTSEPYRMFTSRSEFRLLLRPDNADLRLTEKGYKIGCVSEERYDRCMTMKAQLQEGLKKLGNDVRKAQDWSSHGIPAKKQFSALQLLGIQRNMITMKQLAEIDSSYTDLANNSTVSDRLKYEAFYLTQLKSMELELKDVKDGESLEIPSDMDFYSHKISLPKEAREKFDEAKPSSIGAAGRIPGITPAAVVNLLYYVKKRQHNK